MKKEQYAFPRIAHGQDEGMTLHQYFAGQALMGLSANTSFSDAATPRIAEMATDQADAMMAEYERMTNLNKGDEPK